MPIRALILILVAIATNAGAQERPLRLADSSADVILSRVGELGGLSAISGILRQKDRAQPVAKLDAIADRMVERVVAARSGAPGRQGYAEAVEALSILSVGGALRGASGAPYGGAFDRIIRIHREAASAPLRAVALTKLTTVATGDRALSYLRAVAASSDPTAPNAVEALIAEAQHGGPSGNPLAQRDRARALLRELFEKDLVSEARALKALRHYAGNQGWVKP